MSRHDTYYYCEVCYHESSQKSHSDSHVKTESHIENSRCYASKLIEKKYGELIKMSGLPIEEVEDKTLEQLCKIIIDNMSQIRCNSDEIEEKRNRVIDEYYPKFTLTHELTQFTLGKTEQTLCKISEMYLINSCEIEEHLIQIIVTNKSLSETDQWKIRTKKKFKDFESINVDILSSAQDSSFKSIDTFIKKITKAKTKEDMPNILIICFHPKRVCDDLFELFSCFCGKGLLFNSVKVKFQINFDEPDTNLGVLSDFLRGYIDFKHMITEISFITATPLKNFWKMLAEHSIHSLGNNSIIEEKNYDNYLEKYMQVRDHNIFIVDNKTMNPLEYIAQIFEKNLDKSNRKIIFAPAHVFTRKPKNKSVGSHEEVIAYFQDKNYWIFLSNGKFKGFISPDDERVLVSTFNQKYNITGELRETLVKWNELYPTENLAITGYWTIERGVTFNTSGFNFTDIIISEYHSQQINKLIQLIGRATGHKDYVKKMNIYCTQNIMNTVDTIVEKTKELRRLNPENYNRADFTKSNSTIPVKLTFTDEEYLNLFMMNLTGKSGYKKQIDNLIKEGIETGFIVSEDNNNVNKFTNDKILKNIRVYSIGDKCDSRRFKEFNEAFILRKPVAQSCKSGEYSIDIARDEYNYDDYTNPVNIAWITFRI